MFMDLITIFLFCFVQFIQFSNSFLYDVNYAKTVQQNHAEHFGFSVFLQKGSSTQNSLLIIGAPSASINSTGLVFKCPITENFGAQCEEYSTSQQHAFGEVRYHSNFGATIDGGPLYQDPIMACAPKFTRRYYNTDYFTNGACYFLPSNGNVDPKGGLFPNSKSSDQLTIKNERTIYKFAYGQVGMSLLYDNGTFLMGSPGDYFDAGDVVVATRKRVLQVPDLARKSLIFSDENQDWISSKLLSDNSYIDENSYAGYSVSAGNFHPNAGRTYAVGIPRADYLHGRVLLVGRPITVLRGPKVAEYFGASLCAADVDGDGLDDILVGAPSGYRGERGLELSYDTGVVYQFLSTGRFSKRTRIEGSGINGARFGTAMINLGKITLDKYDSVAISSPFESSGSISIYHGSDLGLDLSQHPHKIYAENSGGISGLKASAFGFSLSRPLDVNSDGTKDLGVGSFLSNSATVLYGKRVFRYDFRIESGVRMLRSEERNEPFDVRFCLTAKTSSINDGRREQVQVTIFAVMDERIVTSVGDVIKNLEMNRELCVQNRLQLVDSLSTISPLRIEYRVNETGCPSCPISTPTSPRGLVLVLPIVNNCGDDQICEPQIDIVAQFTDEANSILVGQNDFLGLKIQLSNTKEPAYTCKILIVPPQGVTFLKSPPSCSRFGDSLSCFVAKPILSKDDIDLQLDMRSFRNLNLQEVDFQMNLTCTNYTNSKIAKLGLKYEHSYEVEGRSLPQSITYKTETELSHFLTFTHEFYVKNAGPSPVSGHKLLIQVPVSFNNFQNDEFLVIAEPKISTGAIECTSDYTFRGEFLNYSPPEVLRSGEPQLRSDPAQDIRCGSGLLRCVEIACNVLFLRKQEGAKIALPMNVSVLHVVEHFQQNFNVVSYAEYGDDNNRLTKEALTCFLENLVEKYEFPWMWVIIGLVIALLLLLGLVFLLHKLHFFSRPLHEKLNEEKDEIEQAEAEDMFKTVEATQSSVQEKEHNL